MILWFLWFANTRDALGPDGSSGAIVPPRNYGRGRVREYELYILPLSSVRFLLYIMYTKTTVLLDGTL